MKIRLTAFTVISLFVVGLNLLSQETKTETPILLLKIKSSIYDSVVTIRYSAPEKMFVELLIVNRQGFVIEEPFSKEIQTGEDSLIIDIGNYLTGTYYVWCKVNHSPISLRMFKHAKKGQQVTYTKEEMTAHDKLPACDSTVCTTGDIASFNDFFKKYPDYMDKGEVFERALLAYIKLDQDSTLISKTIDSLVAYLPTFYTYYTIARYLTEYNKLSSLGAQYIIKARNALGTIPHNQQNKYQAELTEFENKFNR